MAFDEPPDEKLFDEREIGFSKVNQTCTIGTLVEVFLYKGTGLERTNFNEITTKVEDAMTLEEGPIVSGYIIDMDVNNLRPPCWFRVEQLSGSPNENNYVDVDYATVHSIFNHQGCKLVYQKP